MNNYNEYNRLYNCIKIPGMEGNSLIIDYEDGDICMKCTEYDKGNIFYIVRGNRLFIPMKMMFKEIKKNDKLRYLNNNGLGTKFEWISDGDNYARQNRLVIIETFEGFRIQFVKNPCNENEKNNCTIRFSLNNGNNINISKIFDKYISSMMNMSYINDNKTIKR